MLFLVWSTTVHIFLSFLSRLVVIGNLIICYCKFNFMYPPAYWAKSLHCQWWLFKAFHN